MTPDADMLRALAALMREAGIDELEWRSPDWRVRLVAGPAAAGSGETRHQVPVTVRTPGRFLTHHPARAAALAPVGTTVGPGDVLGLVQAGRILTAVTAPCAGTVLQVLQRTGSLVGYGTPVIILAGVAAP